MTMRVMAPPLEPTRSVVFAVSVIVLLVAHQVGDHVFQTDHQATRKVDRSPAGLRAMLGHLAGYHATAAAALAGTGAVLGIPLTIRGVVAGLAFSALTHGLLDRRWPVRVILRLTRSSNFADRTAPICGMYVADQALHQAALLVSALLIATL